MLQMSDDRFEYKLGEKLQMLVTSWVTELILEDLDLDLSTPAGVQAFSDWVIAENLHDGMDKVQVGVAYVLWEKANDDPAHVLRVQTREGRTAIYEGVAGAEA